MGATIEKVMGDKRNPIKLGDIINGGAVVAQIRKARGKKLDIVVEVGGKHFYSDLNMLPYNKIKDEVPTGVVVTIYNLGQKQQEFSLVYGEGYKVTF